MKAIILTRVSTKDQEDNNSIPAQTRRSLEYSGRLDHEVIEVCQLVESSTKANRLKFNEIIARIKASSEVIALVVDTIDRLQRDFRESVVLNELRLEGKIELHFVRESLVITQRSNSAEILRWDMGVMFAKSYVTQLSDNVKRSQEQKVQNGEWLSKAPFGYKNIELVSGKKWIEPDPMTMHIVVDIYRWYGTQACSMRQIRDKLVEDYGVVKSLSSVDQILKNPFYYGMMRIKGQLYEHHYTPLLSKNVFSSAESVASGYKKLPYKYAGLPYFYRGLISCSVCGCRITPEKTKGYIYYHCTQFKGKHKAPYIREEDLTRQFEDAFNGIQPSQQQFDEVIDALKASNADKITYKTQELGRLQAELTKIDHETDKLYESYLEGDIDREYYKKKSLEMKSRHFDIVQRLNSIDRAADDFYENADMIMQIARQAPELFESSEMDEKRRLINLVLQNLELDDHELRWKYKKPFDSMALYKNRSSWQG